MTTTYDLQIPYEPRIGGFAGLAIRLGRALQAWGHRAGRPLDREQVERLIETRRETGNAIVARGDVHHGVHQLLR